MRRVGTLFAVLCLPAGAARSDDAAWRPAAGPAPFPAAPVGVEPAPTASVEPSHRPWVPAAPPSPSWAPVGGIPPGPTVVAVRQPAPPKAETAPAPLPAPRPVPGVPPPVPKPAPAPLPKPAPPTAPPVVRASPPAPASPVWGAVAAGPACPPAPPPVVHGVAGSPNITLSRDRNFLDLFGVGGWADDPNSVVLGESQAGGLAADDFFVKAEYLLWWVNSGRVPVLASTARNSMAGMGYIGQPGTELLLGPGAFGSTARNGVRVRAGAWLGDGAGVDGGVFALGGRTNRAAFDSAQFPTIARPIFAPNFNQEFGELVAFPGLSTGRLEIENTSDLWGADINARCCLCRTCDSHADIFAGYRHLNLRESLTVTEFIQSGPQAPDPPGTSIVVQDRFRVANQFHGGQVGYSFTRSAGRFEWDGRASVALGVTHQDLTITGVQNRTRPGEAPALFRGGLLAAGPNIGDFNRDEFSVVPELTVNLGYRITPGIKAYVGYNFLYWTNVLRPGDQIDRVVDLTFVPNGPAAAFSQNRPVPTFRQSDVVIQGVQFGLEARW